MASLLSPIALEMRVINVCLGLRRLGDPPYLPACPKTDRFCPYLTAPRVWRSNSPIIIETLQFDWKVNPAMTDVLKVKKREQTGSAATRRLRRLGQVPVVLYGHGEDNEHLAVPSDQVKALLRHHGKTVELAGDVKDTALVSDMQWDPLGIEVLHMDLMRVNLSEKVEITVAIHTHGDPVGTREGGILIENQHDVEIRCSAGSIPEHVGLNVADLHLGQSLTAADLELPDGAELITPGDTVVAHIEEPRGATVESAEVDMGSEPEVIEKGGAKDEEED